jgi:hypothetical protein
MLLETIKRYNATQLIKCISIDLLHNIGKTLPQIHSVPALMIMPSKELLFGKSVFDYLLLPKTGKLLQIPEKSKPSEFTISGSDNNQQNNQSTVEEPLSFSMNSNGFSEGFAMIEDDAINPSFNGFTDRSYNWSSIDSSDTDNLQPHMKDISVETREKKEPIDLNELYSRRALELEKNDLNINQLPLPSINR